MHGCWRCCATASTRESPGGKVKLRGDGTPVLDYPLTDFVMDGARRACSRWPRSSSPPAPRQVLPVHELAPPYSPGRGAAGNRSLPMQPLLTKVVSAHVMGGCGMAGERDRGVVRPDGVHWQMENLSVHDGSLFPTSIGANPQLSIYGITNAWPALAKRLSGREVILG